MHRYSIDRWTDTIAFRCALLVSGVLVLPVLALGVLTTVIGGAVLVSEPFAVGIELAVFGLLSAGGVFGVVGHVRAHFGAKRPDHHNVTLTLLCLAVGVVTALAVAGYVVARAIEGLGSPWGLQQSAPLATLFVAANVVWALSGIAWMQRLPRRYAEKTGSPFDTVPVILLFVALALAIAATLNIITL